MKRNLFFLCLMTVIIVSGSVSAMDGYFDCSIPMAEFNGMIFDDLYITPDDHCSGSVLFEKVTVAGNVIWNDTRNDGYTVSFLSSDLNQVSIHCSDGQQCLLRMDSTTRLKELNLYPSASGMITVTGLISDNQLPAFYEEGYLCEGQQDYAAYADAEISIDYQLADLQTFSDFGKIDMVHIYPENSSSVIFDNIWVHRAFIESAGDHTTDNFSLNTSGYTFIDLLDSGISFGLHNRNEAHLPHGSNLSCSYIAGDLMNIGLLLLHSDGNITVSTDRQYIDYVVFFGEGCDRSTLTLDSYGNSSWATDIFQVHVYDANAAFYTKSIQGVYFLIAPMEAPYGRFYQYFDKAEELIRGHRSDFIDPGMLPYLPDTDSAYWNRIDAALVWSQLMPYYNLTPAGLAADGISTVYGRSEPNVPYIYYYAAYIDKIRVLNAYGSSDGQIPDYIRQKDWSSPNPFITGGQVRLCENGGCGFNHNMSLGTVSFKTSIQDLHL